MGMKKREKRRRAWKLEHEFLGEDAEWTLIGVDAYELNFLSLDATALPDSFELEVDPAVAGTVVDYPRNSASWPIMSAQMLSVLRQVSNFAHRAIPVTLVDPKKRPVKHRALGKYFVVQTLDYAARLDWATTEYEPIEDQPGHVFVTKASFVPGDSELPALFRAEELCADLFVSAAARDALAREKITGVELVAEDDVYMSAELPMRFQEGARARRSTESRQVAASELPTERKLQRGEKAELRDWMQVAAHLDPFYEHNLEDPDEIVQAISEAVDTYRETQQLPLRDFADTVDLALALGAWLIEALKPHGVAVVSLDYDGDEEIAIVPEDRSWALLPLRFLHRMLTTLDETNTTILTYNICKTGRRGGGPGSYVTVA